MGAGVPLKAMAIATPRVVEELNSGKEPARIPLLVTVELIVMEPRQNL